MEIDIKGRLIKFPLSVEKPLMPLFEAISNSIHAISEANVKKSGLITICIHRDTTPPSLGEGIKAIPPVVGFTITDNGIGFNDENYKSFSTSDSTYKLKFGGKGVGRFTWLKVFEKAEIKSIFKHDSSLKQRNFSFSESDVEWDGTLHDVDISSLQQTTIRFCGMNPEYQRHCPKNGETIVRKIIEHFLTHFSIVRVPKIVLKDEFDDATFDLNEEFENRVKIKVEREQINVCGQTLKLVHFYLRIGTGDTNHNLHLCVNRRSAEEYQLRKLNSIFEEKFYEGSLPFVYSCCVSGEFFDKRANDSRTKLDLIDNSNDLLATGREPTRNAILDAICKCSEKQLSDYVTPIKEKNLDRVRGFIQKNVRYRPLLGSRKEWLEHVRCGLSDEELNIELFKLLQRLESENLRDGQQLKSSRIEKKTKESLDEHRQRLDRFLEETNALGLAKLAEYVVHRRAVINFVKECKEYKTQLPNNEEGYEYEEAIHNIIFPMRKTSETIQRADFSNLWMLDDRLSYHFLLASDLQGKQLKQIIPSDESKNDRMDLLILQSFDRPHAFVGSSEQPFNSVTIVEFKRPMRNDYTATDDKKDPFQQVWNYAEAIGNRPKRGTCPRSYKHSIFCVYCLRCTRQN